jgi:hypothetical protein
VLRPQFARVLSPTIPLATRCELAGRFAAPTVLAKLRAAGCLLSDALSNAARLGAPIGDTRAPAGRIENETDASPERDVRTSEYAARRA